MKAHMAHQIYEKFKQLVISEIIDEWSVVASDIINAYTSFGPNGPGLIGKTVLQRTECAVPEYLDIPQGYYLLKHFVNLTVDVMFVKGIPFLATLSRDNIFGMAEHVPYRTAKQLAKSLMKVVKLYVKGGFGVSNVLMDGEFENVNP